jgi:hypothetical protein
MKMRFATTMELPTPHDLLGGCVWLPRIMAKARLLLAGQLPEEFAARFCAANGVDGQFLSYFRLTREAVLAAAALTDPEVVAWFLALPSAIPERIEEWNRIAENLGRAGFPMAERLPIAKTVVYPHLDTAGIETIFALIDLDEGRANR